MQYKCRRFATRKSGGKMTVVDHDYYTVIICSLLWNIYSLLFTDL